MEEQAEWDKIRYLLEGEGYEVDQARSATGALAQIERERFDTILVQIPVGDIDGIEMLHRIRERDPSAVVIAMGGYAAFEAAIEAWRYDVSGYIPCPVDDPDQVLAVVASGLAERSKKMVPAAILASCAVG
jgi:UDP-3-O-[3-hydroxymyristoyl] N-acetylglucosamine deacetylase